MEPPATGKQTDPECGDVEGSSYAFYYRGISEALNRLKHVIRGALAITKTAKKSSQ